MKLSYSDIFVTIATDKVKVVTDFYSQLLEQQPTVYRLPIYAEFKLEKLRLAIFQPKAENIAEFAAHSSSLSLCLEVEDLDRAISHVSALDCPPSGEIITASHGREIYAYDPAGNRLILHQSN